MNIVFTKEIRPELNPSEESRLTPPILDTYEDSDVVRP